MPRDAHCNNTFQLPVAMTTRWFVLVMMVMLVIAGNRASAQTHASDRGDFEPFSFILVGDPQIGYGNGFEQGSYQRFVDQSKILNYMSADLIIMPGDLVHANNPYQWKLFMQGLKQYTTPAYLIPGKHDVESLIDLERYRDRLGFDYYDFVIKNCAFIMINSQTAKDDSIDATEHIQQWNWLEKTLEEHHLANRRHIFLVMNQPLYRQTYDEKEGYENWPRETRNKVLKLIKKYNVSAVLAGHLRQTTEQQLHGSEARTYTVGGTSGVSDEMGHGFRMFHIDEEGISEEYQVFDPTFPKHWQFLGIKGWVPPILKMDPVNMGVVGVCVLAMLLCYRTWGHWKYIRYTRPARFWALGALFMMFLGLNEAFALNELCLILGAQFDYLPMHARGGITLPSAALLLVPTVALIALLVYHRYYIVAKYGWLALAAMMIGACQFILSLSTYEPWVSWTNTWQWSVTLVVSSLVVCEMALLSASFSSQKYRQPAKMSKPRQVSKQPVEKRPLIRQTQAIKPVVRSARRSQPRPVSKLSNDVMMVAMIRTGRRP